MKSQSSHDAGDKKTIFNLQFSISNTTKKKTPKFPFEKVKNEVLGKRYELSLVFCGSTLSRRLNRALRGKDKPTNVLSFQLSENSGEIFIDLSRTEPFGVEKLFVHGLLHLKGMQHGDTMEKKEEEILKIHDKTHRSRYRYRNGGNKNGHRRRA